MQGKANLVERVITARNDSGTRKSCAESTAQKKARLSIEKLTIHAGKTARPREYVLPILVCLQPGRLLRTRYPVEVCAVDIPNAPAGRAPYAAAERSSPIQSILVGQ